MKKILLVALVGVIAALCILFQQQRRKSAEETAAALAAKQQLAEVEAEAEKRERRNQSEQARLSSANAQLAEKAAKAKEFEQALATNATSLAARGDTAKPKHPMAGVLRDPDMRETLRKQAEEAVARSVKALATRELLQQLGLDNEQAAAFKQLLARRGTLGFDFMMPVMTGELDEAGLAELGRKTKSDMAAVAGELKAFLGDDGYKAFEAYEKGQPDREHLDKLGARLKESGGALSPELRGQLLAVMAEERNNFRFAIDYNDTSQIDFEHFHDYYAEDKMNNYFAEMEQLNNRMLQRAQDLLPAEQAAEFQEILKAQLQKGKYVVKTTQAMLGKAGTR
jgi:hypothetical protein